MSTTTTTTTATAPKPQVRIERNAHGVLCMFIAGICIPAKDAGPVAEILRSKSGLDAVLHDLDLVAGIASKSSEERPLKIKGAKDGNGAAHINKSESERERRNSNPDKATIPPMVAKTGEPIKTSSDIQAEINPDAKPATKTPKQAENAADRLPPCCPKCGNSACTCGKVETPIATDAEKAALLAECKRRGIKQKGLHWCNAEKLRALITQQDQATAEHQEILDKPVETTKTDDKSSLIARCKELGIKGQGLHKCSVETLRAKIAAKQGTDEPQAPLADMAAKAKQTSKPAIAGETTAKVADKPGVFITHATGHDGVVYSLYRKADGEIVARVMGKLANAS